MFLSAAQFIFIYHINPTILTNSTYLTSSETTPFIEYFCRKRKKRNKHQ